MGGTRLVARLVLVCALSATAQVAPQRAAAQDAYACIDRLSDAEVEHRLAWIVRAFDDGKRRARMWWYGWTTFAIGAVAFTWTAYGLTRGDGRDERDPALISAIGSSGLLTQAFALPLHSAFVPQRLRRLPDATPEERRAKLRRATRDLERSARREAMLRGIGPHVGPFVFAIGTGTFLVVRHDDIPFAVALAFLAPPIIGESKVLSLTWNATRSWDRYRSFACQPPHAGPADEESLDEVSARLPDAPRSEWSLVPAGLGLGVRFSF